MKSPRVEASRVVDAPPATVYKVLRDYREHHPRILPKPAFEGLDVESGGVGDGTVIRVAMRVMGSRKTFRMRVTEPEPGRVLAETDVDSGAVTTFTVTPEDGGERSLVRIETAWRPRSGLAGLVERLVNPRVVKPLYEEELRNLDRYARTLA